MPAQAAVDLVFMALTVWREARGETAEAQVAVARAIATRVKHPGWWGRDVLSVVTKPWQFSSLTDPKDPQLVKWPSSADASWLSALAVAEAVLSGSAADPCPGADSYFDISIPAPKWATDDKFIRQVGRIRFYKVQP